MSRNVRVKICGISDIESARAAVRAGADALGFVFAPGRRQVSPETAREIIKKLPPFIARVGVFVNPPATEVNDIANFAGLDTIQLHGSETPEFCRQFDFKIIKSFGAAEDLSPGMINRYDVDAFLLDTAGPGGLCGGTGKTWNWRRAARFQEGTMILAGGLTAENVLEAISVANPYAVDVSSGVESNGKKDPLKIREFIRRVKD